MRTLGTLVAAALLTAGVAVADDATMQSGEVTKKTTHSTTVQSNPGGQPEVQQRSDTKVETSEHKATDDMSGKESSHSEAKVEKKSSTSVTAENPGSGSQRHVESETHHEQSSKTATQQ